MLSCTDLSMLALQTCQCLLLQTCESFLIQTCQCFILLTWRYLLLRTYQCLLLQTCQCLFLKSVQCLLLQTWNLLRIIWLGGWEGLESCIHLRLGFYHFRLVVCWNVSYCPQGTNKRGEWFQQWSWNSLKLLINTRNFLIKFPCPSSVPSC